MKRIISMSVYGTDPKYTDAVIKNIELQPDIYPGWDFRIYHDEKVPQNIIEKIKEYNNVELIKMPNIIGHLKMFWRFYPLMDTSIERFIVRDTDSRLNIREAAAVKEWIESEKEFHIMRDHEQHGAYICGGMWGATSEFINKIKDKYDDLKNNFIKTLTFNEIYGSRGAYFNSDQKFLWKIIWPKIINNHIAHIKDLPNLRFTGNEKLFPIENIDNSFVGQPY
jgi:hypothetical protein